MKNMFRIPDYLIYAIIVGLIVIYSNIERSTSDAALPPDQVGDLLPNDSPFDPNILIDIDAPSSGIGTAFAINKTGTWLTARHVVDGCDHVGLRMSDEKFLPVTTEISQEYDLATLTGDWKRSPIRSDLYSPRYLGENGFFFGFPQGRPGEVTGKLLGRGRMKVKGRYNTNESILAWAESGRSAGLKGSLGGLSGGPVLDKDGEIIGVVAAESIRRGRIYSVVPRNLRELVTYDKTFKARSIALSSYGLQADVYRRNRQIVQVLCLVN